mgnify:CR=1 FL=1
MISFSVSFVLLLCMVHFISFLLNAKHEKSLNVFIPILTQTSSNELYNNEQSLENTNTYQYVYKMDPPTGGYVSALIVTFMTGALGGMIAMILMNLAK